MIDCQPIAERLGYPSEQEMWKDLYCTKKLSIQQLAEKLDVGRNTVRDALDRMGIQVKPRGGPNHVKVIITEELIERVRQEGIRPVAVDLGVAYTTLYKRLFHVRQPKPPES